MMKSTYILPDVLKSPYALEGTIEIKDEPETEDELYDSSTATEPSVEDIRLQICEEDEDTNEVEDEPLVEIDSITVPQDLVEVDLKPTLLFFVNSNTHKNNVNNNIENVSTNKNVAFTLNKNSTLKNNSTEDCIAKRKAITKALRSIKKKSNLVLNNDERCSGKLKQGASETKTDQRSNDSENVAERDLSPCSSREDSEVKSPSRKFETVKNKKIIRKSGRNSSKKGKPSTQNNLICESKIDLAASTISKYNSGFNRKIKRDTSIKENRENNDSLQKTTKKSRSEEICEISPLSKVVFNSYKDLDTPVKPKTFSSKGCSKQDKTLHGSKHDSFDCTVCGKKFKQKSHLATHFRAHIEIRNFKCNECGNTFKNKVNLLFHLKTHEEAPFICEKCDKIFPERKVLKRHIRIVHSGEGKYKCEICGRSFKSLQHLELHYTLHTGNKPFVCNVCGKSFVYKVTYTTHMRAHAADDAFSCEQCPDTSNKGEQRRRCQHFSDSRPWLCTICGKGYPLKSTLKNHMKIHEPDRAFRCDECGKTFVKKQAYESHIKIHSGENPQFMCDQCSQSYLTVFALKRHYIKHTSERKFVCDTCSKAFWTKDSLKVHKRSHTGVKLFQCTLCPKSFAHKHTLVAHSKTHCTEQSFSCTACPKTFTHKYNLDRHERQHRTMAMAHMPSPPQNMPLPPSLIMMAPPKHLDFSTLHIL